jgi:FkbM family methyltransferase
MKYKFFPAKILLGETLDIFNSRLKESPFVIYDVGAAVELYSIAQGYADGRFRFVGFEPLPTSYENLLPLYSNNPLVDLHNFALGVEEAEANFFVQPDAPGASSLVSRNFEGISREIIKVKIKTIDSLVAAGQIPPPDFMKVDTEGSELNVLRGGTETLDKNLIGVVSEVAFWRPDDGIKFSDIDQHLQKNGFVLFDVDINRGQFTGIGGKKGKVRTGDALYLRNFEDIYEKHLENDKELAQRKLIKLVVVAARYLYLDYALELLDFGKRAAIISDEDYKSLTRLYASIADRSYRFSSMPGAKKLRTIFGTLSYLFSGSVKKGTPPLFNSIGNDVRLMRIASAPKHIDIYHPVMGDKARILRLNIP